MADFYSEKLKRNLAIHNWANISVGSLYNCENPILWKSHIVKKSTSPRGLKIPLIPLSRARGLSLEGNMYDWIFTAMHLIFIRESSAARAYFNKKNQSGCYKIAEIAELQESVLVCKEILVNTDGWFILSDENK